jgi:hypothetical protein
VTRWELARRLSKVRARAGEGSLRPVTVIRMWRSDVDPAWQEAALAAIERPARAELVVLGMPPELLLIVGIDEDGVGVAEAGGWRWQLWVEPDPRNGATAAVVTQAKTGWSV